MTPDQIVIFVKAFHRRATAMVGGPAPKIPFFQMVLKSFLSVLIYYNRCEYDILKVWLNRNDQNLPVEQVEHDDRVLG
jgi:hypothetical protein